MSWHKDSIGRIISVLVSINNLKINLVNICAPTNLADRKVLFENLHEFFLPADAIILGSDFEHEFDKFGGNVSIAKYLSDFRAAFSFTDIWHKLHLRSCDVSWYNSNFTVGSCLNKFFMS